MMCLDFRTNRFRLLTWGAVFFDEDILSHDCFRNPASNRKAPEYQDWYRDNALSRCRDRRKEMLAPRKAAP
jgi:hypothetical protein